MPPKPVTPNSPQPRIPILLHLRAPINLQHITPIIIQPRTPNAPIVARLWSGNRGAPPPQSEAQRETNGSDTQSQGNQSNVQVQAMEQTQAQEQKEMSCSQGSTRTHHFLKVQDVTKPLTELHPPTELPETLPQATTSKPRQPPSQGGGLKNLTRRHGTVKSLLKRKRELEAAPAAKRSSSCGLEPVEAQSTKPWPVFTFAGPVPTQTAKPLSKIDRYKYY